MLSSGNRSPDCVRLASPEMNVVIDEPNQLSDASPDSSGERSLILSTVPIAESTKAFLVNRSDWAVLAALVVIEVLTFGLFARQIGFYLDDWATFCQLHFAPHNFFDVLRSSFSDPRMVTRPFQCFYYASAYMAFGDNPLGYHIVRCIIEIVGGVCLYFAASRLLGRRLPAAVAAIVFMLFPSHDASHYWIGAGLGAGCGASLYLCSLWLSVEATLRRSPVFAACSAAAFLLCAYCYEAFLPMLSLTFFAVLYIEASREKFLVALLRTFKFLVPSLLIGVSEPIYQRAVVPLFSKVFLSPGTFDPGYALNVFLQGIAVTVGSTGWSFFGDRAREALSQVKPGEALRLAGVAASVSTVLFLTNRSDKNEPRPFLEQRTFLLYWVTACAAVLLCSYLTFAVAQGYTPTLYSMINRVNMGASIAVSLLIGILLAPLPVPADRGSNRNLAVQLGFARTIAVSVVLSLFLTLSNWGMAPYWVQSWAVQKRVGEMVRERAGFFHSGDSILLANTPRYVMWAPVFDGVWDFQSLVWMMLNNRNISGGVISERFEVSVDAIRDNSAGFLCATYKYPGLNLLVPDGNQLIPVNSAGQFITTVRQKGMNFGLSPEVLERWRSTSMKSGGAVSPSAAKP